MNDLESLSVTHNYAVSLHWSFSRLHGLTSYFRAESEIELLAESVLIFISLLLSSLSLLSCYQAMMLSYVMLSC